MQTYIKSALIILGLFMLGAIGVLALQAQTNSTQLASVPVQDSLIQSSKEQSEARLAEQKRTEEAAQAAEDALLAEETAKMQAAQAAAEAEVPAVAATPQEDEGAPEGYVGWPPQCKELWWLSLPGELPIRYRTSVLDGQTNVTISAYKLFANGALVDTSTDNVLSYMPDSPGTYTFHSIMKTNFGPTLKNTNCMHTLEVEPTWFD